MYIVYCKYEYKIENKICKHYANYNNYNKEKLIIAAVPVFLLLLL